MLLLVTRVIMGDSMKMGECMEVEAWWLVYGRSPSFKVNSVMIPSVVEVVAERAVIVVAEATAKAEDAQKRFSQMRYSGASGRSKPNLFGFSLVFGRNLVNRQNNSDTRCIGMLPSVVGE